MKQAGFFDAEERLSRLSGLGDQLEAFSWTVDFEAFRPDLDKALAYADGSKGGRPPFDPVLMFKILVIQTLNTLSDERTEYLINDRLEGSSNPPSSNMLNRHRHLRNSSDGEAFLSSASISKNRQAA
ncbi:transposase [Acetobacter aceti]|uniref:Transposase InsH N-terminal domain-containing protein n=1 Tax=Acetobacter aceti TaxID=435 RepID=A0A6S6PFZ3_ACEAC|nr:transposase [Acetobacter aceti]BCI65896.1 hypothetical protein AAJCM20276_05200 [Acetobacter aceti]